MSLLVAAAFLLQPLSPSSQPGFSHPGEEPVEPYEIADANAGATPYAHDRHFRAFGGREGIDRIVDRFVALNVADPRIGDVFRGHDLVRIRRTLKEQFCYILGGGCAYTGRDMRSSHANMGVQMADFTALVDNLQRAMTDEQVPFRAQNRLLVKLAPMYRDTVER